MRRPTNQPASTSRPAHEDGFERTATMVRPADPKLLLERAQEARAIAEDMRTVEAQRMMFELAQLFEEMARRTLEKGETGSG